MRWLKRLGQRVLVLWLGIATVWLIVSVVFRTADNRLPWYIAVGVTYGLAAYVILPHAMRMALKILQRRHVPSFTVTTDGLPGDPVNLMLVGTLAQLRAAFAAIGWQEADALGLASGWRMVRAFLLKVAYPSAPFSPLFLFGRSQDIGFQQAIGTSPRQRHHIRFWAMPLAQGEAELGSVAFWTNTDRPPDGAAALWVGAGTRDTGFALTRLTFKITHATDADTNRERDFIITTLEAAGMIHDATRHHPGEEIARVNHYITDGEITVATLAPYPAA